MPLFPCRLLQEVLPEALPSPLHIVGGALLWAPNPLATLSCPAPADWGLSNGRAGSKPPFCDPSGKEL